VDDFTAVFLAASLVMLTIFVLVLYTYSKLKRLEKMLK